MYIIETRYECWKRNGLDFCPWFKSHSCDTEEQALEIMQNLPKKINKQKREYRIQKVEN